MHSEHTMLVSEWMFWTATHHDRVTVIWFRQHDDDGDSMEHRCCTSRVIGAWCSSYWSCWNPKPHCWGVQWQLCISQWIL